MHVARTRMHDCRLLILLHILQVNSIYPSVQSAIQPHCSTNFQKNALRIPQRLQNVMKTKPSIYEIRINAY